MAVMHYYFNDISSCGWVSESYRIVNCIYLTYFFLKDNPFLELPCVKTEDVFKNTKLDMKQGLLWHSLKCLSQTHTHFLPCNQGQHELV